MKITAFSKFYPCVAVFLALFLLPSNLKAQEASSENDLSLIRQVPQPFYTDLIKQKVNDEKNYLQIKRDYKSRLSQKEIFEFYRDFFLSKGLKENHSAELPNQGNVKAFAFSKGLLTNAVLGMFTYYAGHSKEVFYSVTIMEVKDILFLSQTRFTPAKNLSFMPAYANAMQYSAHKHEEEGGIMSTTCLMPAEIKDVADFYLREMPKRGWSLASKNERQGRHNIFTVLVAGHPLINQPLKVKPEEFAPGVDVEIRGATLIFQKGQEKCIININEFLDSSQDLKKMRIDPAALEKYGRVLLNAVYYAKKSTE